jgi:hypothetical protein
LKTPVCRVGVICLSLQAQPDKSNDLEDGAKRSREGWQGASVGAVSAKRGQVFIWDLAEASRVWRETGA